MGLYISLLEDKNIIDENNIVIDEEQEDHVVEDQKNIDKNYTVEEHEKNNTITNTHDTLIIENLDMVIQTNRTNLSYDLGNVFPNTTFYVGNNGKKYVALNDFCYALGIKYDSDKLKEYFKFLKYANEKYALSHDEYELLGIVLTTKKGKPCKKKQLISEPAILLFLASYRFYNTLNKCLLCMYGI